MLLPMAIYVGMTFINGDKTAPSVASNDYNRTHHTVSHKKGKKDEKL
jgi:hypothetical protein